MPGRLPRPRTEKPSADFIRKTYYRRKRKFSKWVWPVAFAVLAVFALVGTFLVSRESRQTGEEDVVLSVGVPKNMVSGKDMKLSVSVYNNGAVDIAEAGLTVDFPKGFVFEDSVPKAFDRLAGAGLWLLGEIPANSRKTVEITGQLLGEAGEKRNFEASLDYQLEGLSAKFRKSGFAETNISKSALFLEIEFPGRVFQGEDFEYSVTVENAGENLLEEVEVLAVYPKEFAMESADPEPREDSLFAEEGEDSWSVGSLQPGEKKELSLIGRFSEGGGEFKGVSFSAGTRDASGSFLLLSEREGLVFIVEPGLYVGLNVEGEEKELYSIDWGEALDCELVYENRGDLKIEDVVLSVGLADIAAAVIDREKTAADTRGGCGLPEFVAGEKGSEMFLCWDKSDIPGLDVLSPGDKGSVEFEIFIKPPPSAAEVSFQKYLFAASAAGEGRIAGFDPDKLSGVSVKAESKQAKARLNSSMFLETEVRPAVGEVEGESPGKEGFLKYWISWKLSNTTNEMEDVEVVTVLPAGVFWAGESRTTVGQGVEYDNQTREVSWRIASLPPFSGRPGSSSEAVFKLEIPAGFAPESGMTGEILLRARDGFTGKEFFAKQGPARAR